MHFFLLVILLLDILYITTVEEDKKKLEENFFFFTNESIQMARKWKRRKLIKCQYVLVALFACVCQFYIFHSLYIYVHARACAHVRSPFLFEKQQLIIFH